ncbi:hypothetical protein RFI_03689, partial [Reticulomyxa filosa]
EKEQERANKGVCKFAVASNSEYKLFKALIKKKATQQNQKSQYEFNMVAFKKINKKEATWIRYLMTMDMIETKVDKHENTVNETTTIFLQVQQCMDKFSKYFLIRTLNNIKNANDLNKYIEKFHYAHRDDNMPISEQMDQTQIKIIEAKIIEKIATLEPSEMSCLNIKANIAMNMDDLQLLEHIDSKQLSDANDSLQWENYYFRDELFLKDAKNSESVVSGRSDEIDSQHTNRSNHSLPNSGEMDIRKNDGSLDNSFHTKKSEQFQEIYLKYEWSQIADHFKAALMQSTLGKCLPDEIANLIVFMSAILPSDNALKQRRIRFVVLFFIALAYFPEWVRKNFVG